MYRKLLAYVNRFVHIRQGGFSRYYEGKLLSVDPECMELQTFDSQGRKLEVWTISLSTVTEFSVGSVELSALELRVKWANSPDTLEPDARPREAVTENF
jgi:hypothetical protein